jgi:hypothetical protein
VIGNRFSPPQRHVYNKDEAHKTKAPPLYVVKQEPGHLFFNYFYLYKVNPKRK